MHTQAHVHTYSQKGRPLSYSCAPARGRVSATPFCPPLMQTSCGAVCPSDGGGGGAGGVRQPVHACGACAAVEGVWGAGEDAGGVPVPQHSLAALATIPAKDKHSGTCATHVFQVAEG
eukprot:1161421-Pelagomonas_calceolata.AAC.8